MPQIDITIDFSESGTDPGRVPGPAGLNSNGDVCFLKPVLLRSKQSIGPENNFLIEVTKADTVLNFSFANAPVGADPKFTGFQYYNTGDKFWKSGWYIPGHLHTHEFLQAKISSPDRLQMSVTDRVDNHTLYFFVVEWSEVGTDGERINYCCDPKIKNEPGGGVIKKVTLWGSLRRLVRKLLSRLLKVL